MIVDLPVEYKWIFIFFSYFIYRYHVLYTCNNFFSNQTILFNFYTTIISGEILELYYLETQKDQNQNIVSSKALHLLRTVGVSLKEHNPVPFNLYVIIYFCCIVNAYILMIHHALCQTYVYMLL